MKRFLIGIILLMMASMSASAQKHQFKINAEGVCEIRDTMDINVTKSDCYRIIKEWLYTVSCVSLSFSNEKKNESLTFNNVFYAQKRYNSFSGTYSDNLSINCDMKIEEGKLIYRIYDIQLIKLYVGYDATASIYPVEERLHKIKIAKSVIENINNDKALSKSVKRIALDEQKEIIDYEDVLDKCYTVLMSRLENLRGMVQWTDNNAEEDTEEVPFQ